MKAAEIIADPDYGRLKHHVVAHTGLAYYLDKDGDFALRLGRRIEARKARSCGEYLQILREDGPLETDALIAELTIGETYFFRQSEHFDALRELVLPDLIERNRDTRKLRIWSAGCATGAEPYSVALLLRTDFADRLSGWDISILGTDINRGFLEQAESGRFDDWRLRASSEELKKRYFQRERREWVLRPEYRRWTSFEYHNLAADPPPLPAGARGFDLILCRNVLIYFGPERIRTTAERFHEALSDGGWLLVGHAELNSEVFREFRTVFAHGAIVYRKPGGVEPRAPEPLLAPASEPLPLTDMRGPGANSPGDPAGQAPVSFESVAEPNELREIRALADRGQWDDATRRCKALLESDNLNAAAHFTYALILEHTGLQELGEEYLRRAIYLDRGFELAHYHLGLSFQRRGAAAKARRSFMNAIELLALRPEEAELEHGDGITARELSESAKLHVNLLERK